MKQFKPKTDGPPDCVDRRKVLLSLGALFGAALVGGTAMAREPARRTRTTKPRRQAQRKLRRRTRRRRMTTATRAELKRFEAAILSDRRLSSQVTRLGTNLKAITALGNDRNFKFGLADLEATVKAAVKAKDRRDRGLANPNEKVMAPDWSIGRLTI